MVSAVFHSPLDAARRAPQRRRGAASRAAGRAAPRAAAPRSRRPRSRASTGARSALRVLPPLLGIALLVAIWALLAMKQHDGFPTPRRDLRQQAVKVFADPFYRKGPNDQGIGWNILFSLQRVGDRLRPGGAVGIPLGFVIGRFEFLNRMVDAADQPAAAGVAARLAADRPAGVQGAPTRRRSGPSSSARSGR